MELVTVIVVKDLQFEYDTEHFTKISNYYIETKNIDTVLLEKIKNEIFVVELYNLDLTRFTQNKNEIENRKEKYNKRDIFDKLVQKLLYDIDKNKFLLYENKLENDKIIGTIIIYEERIDNDYDMFQYLFNK